MKATLAKLSASVTLSAGAQAEGDKPAGPPTFDAVAYSGGKVPGYTLTPPLKGEYVVDLAGMSEGKGMKANLDHKTTQRVGHVISFVNDGKQVQVAGALSAATSYRDEVRNSAADGYQWEVSIEASLSKPRKVEAGQTANVNGRIVEGPLTIFGKSTLKALSFVSNGADEGNLVTIAASADLKTTTLRELREQAH